MSREPLRLARFCLRRIAHALPLGLALLTVAFALVHLAPGDPLLLLAGDGGTPAYYAEMREHYGLDRPLPVQFVRYMAGALRGQLGYSFSYQRPVLDVIAERLPSTLLLTGAALAIGVVTGLVLALAGTAYAGRVRGRLVRALLILLYALPVFWVGQMLMIALAFQLGLFPTSGQVSARGEPMGLARAVDVARHLVLPSVTLGLSFAAVVGRVASASLLAALDREFARAARARGVSRARLLWSHALPNSLLPGLSVAGHQAGLLLSGAALVESLFAWPGIGRLLIDACLQRDTPLALAIVVVGFGGVVLANLVTDVLYAVADPRVDLA